MKQWLIKILKKLLAYLESAAPAQTAGIESVSNVNPVPMPLDAAATDKYPSFTTTTCRKQLISLTYAYLDTLDLVSNNEEALKTILAKNLVAEIIPYMNVTCEKGFNTFYGRPENRYTATIEIAKTDDIYKAS